MRIIEGTYIQTVAPNDGIPTDNIKSLTIQRKFRKATIPMGIAVAIWLGSALVCALVAMNNTDRNKGSAGCLWAFAGFLLGPLAFIPLIIVVGRSKQKEQQRGNPANLMDCPTCGNQVSRNAESCPHCGEPITPTTKNTRMDETLENSE